MPFTKPEQGKVEMRFDSTGALYARSNSVTEVTVAPAGGAAGGAFAYTAGDGLYGTNNLNSVSDDSIQIGNGAIANGDRSAIAIGYQANSPSYYAIAIGDRARATSNRSTALGYKAYADTGTYATAIGSYANATGVRSFAGGLARAYGSRAVAIGDGTRGYGDNSTALGRSSYVKTGHSASTAIGSGVQSTGANEFNIGVSNVDKITFDTWTPTVAAAKASTHQVPVLIGGVRYNLLVSNV